MKISIPKSWFKKSADIEESSEVGAGCPAAICSAESKRISELEEALKDANGMCRSAMAIAKRNGSANWPAFKDRLSESLERQHAVMHKQNGES